MSADLAFRRPNVVVWMRDVAGRRTCAVAFSCVQRLPAPRYAYKTLHNAIQQLPVTSVRRSMQHTIMRQSSQKLDDVMRISESCARSGSVCQPETLRGLVAQTSTLKQRSIGGTDSAMATDASKADLLLVLQASPDLVASISDSLRSIPGCCTVLNSQAASGICLRLSVDVPCGTTATPGTAEHILLATAWLEQKALVS